MNRTTKNFLPSKTVDYIGPESPVVRIKHRFLVEQFILDLFSHTVRPKSSPFLRNYKEKKTKNMLAATDTVAIL